MLYRYFACFLLAMFSLYLSGLKPFITLNKIVLCTSNANRNASEGVLLNQIKNKTVANERIHRFCICGRMKITALRGLRIHKGKKKCSCNAEADETRRPQSHVEHHNPLSPLCSHSIRTVQHQHLSELQSSRKDLSN